MCYCTEYHGVSPFPAPPGEPLAPKELQCLSEILLRFSHGALSARTAAGTRGSRHCPSPTELGWLWSSSTSRAQVSSAPCTFVQLCRERWALPFRYVGGGGAGNEGFAIWILATCSKPVNYTGYCDMPSYSTQPPHPNMALLQLLRTVVALIGALSGNSELCIVPLSSILGVIYI
jgi:hypothetical protein